MPDTLLCENEKPAGISGPCRFFYPKLFAFVIA
ncbi:hypothetical protein X474_05960 [Dethiosulfatarculus sandiegensis]|uniref:Uncharacterized protein n=1 Tax=Dethiosulfatarculus sandiegensis TaxID=1429043 RepID=A0A0D2JH54_9BACT|nr:hypothetical protein X474_05960 [Dethiosulfatarculus sandiegensis]